MTPTVDNIPITDLLDIILRSGCREWACPPQSVVSALKKADPMETYCHIEEGTAIVENTAYPPKDTVTTKVWEIKAWQDNKIKRHKLKEAMAVVRVEYDEKKAKHEAVAKILVDKYGQDTGIKIFNQIINGELPKLKEKFGL